MFQIFSYPSKVYFSLGLLGILSFLTLWGIDRLNLGLKQIFYFLIGFGLIFVIQRLKFNFFHKKFLIIFGLIIFILMIGAAFWGYKKAWIKLYFFSLQPIEFLKIYLILIMSYFLKTQTKIKNFLTLLPFLIILSIVSILTVLQKDMGSLFILIILWLFLIFNYLNLKMKVFLISFFVLVFLFLWLWGFKDYQKERILNFIFPQRDIFGYGYNAFQSKISFFSGGLLGKGFHSGYQAIYGFLPSASTDFLLAAFVEQFGLIGLIIFLIIFSFFWFNFSKIERLLKDPEELIFLNGLKIWYFSQFTINSLMNIGLFPVIGLPLPFFSYGGSHLLAEFLGIAILFKRF